MATIDMIGYRKNDRRKNSYVGIGKLGFTDSLTSGDVYKVAAVPAGAIVTNVFAVVTTAFNGTTPTLDVGITGSGALYFDDESVTAAGIIDAAVTPAYYANGTVVTITPTFTNTTAGEVAIYVEYLSTTDDGSYATEQ